MELKIIDIETANLAKEVGYVIENKDWYLLINHYAVRSRNKQKKHAKIDMSYKEGELFTYPENLDMNGDDGSPVLHKDRLAAPTQELLKKFLRDKHKLHVEVNLMQSGFYRVKVIREMGIYDDKKVFRKVDIDTYEQALEAGLKEALNYLLNQNQNYENVHRK